MAKKDNKTNFQQSAGLIRYFDAEEETALKIDPRFVLIAAFAMAVIVVIVEQLPGTRLV